MLIRFDLMGVTLIMEVIFYKFIYYTYHYNVRLDMLYRLSKPLVIKHLLFGILNRQRQDNQCTRHSIRQLRSWLAGEGYQGYCSEPCHEALVSEGRGA